MGMVYRKAYTMPVPRGAEIIETEGRWFARWRLRNRRTREAEVVKGSDGRVRVRGLSKFYMARYKDGNGTTVEVSTGCRDETAANQVLADLMKRAERVRAGIVTPDEDAVIHHRTVPLESHRQSYMRFLRGKRVNGRRVSTMHADNVERNLRRLFRECRFDRLERLSRVPLERWLARQEAEGMGARMRNAHLAAVVAFANWCVLTHRLIANPFHRMPKANEKADRRRQRRAMTEEELARLLDVARRRPLLDAMIVRRGPRRGQPVARIGPETRRKLERLGWERALTYKMLVLTGLRKGELASLTLGQLDLDAGPNAVAYAVLKPEDEKNGQGSQIPLRADLAADLRLWLAANLKLEQEHARSHVAPIPSRLSPEMPLFDVPAGLIRIFDLDLVAAGLAKRVERNGKWIIDKRDDRGRTLDVHALRHTFATHLSRGGVAPRTAQAALRHSTLELTMNTYTDPTLLNVAGALDTLPMLPLERDSISGEAPADVAPAGRMRSA